MRTGEPVPIRIRGEEYPSESAAARALGVSQSAVHRALERGTLDRVGVCKACPHSPHNQPERSQP